jgi:hypothetical protein
MLTRKSFFTHLVKNREAYHFLINAFAVGEADSARELGRVAEHITDPELRAKVERHYSDELKHGRIMSERLRELGGEPRPLPPELDYDQELQRLGYGLAYSRLDDPRPLDDAELIEFFVGSKINEERAISEMEELVEHLAADPGTQERLVELLNDEYYHVAYATQELNRLADRGHREHINTRLRHCRRLEAYAHRVVSVHFMDRLLGLLGYSALTRLGARLAVEASYSWRWMFPGSDLEPETPKPPRAGSAANGKLRRAENEQRATL